MTMLNLVTAVTVLTLVTVCSDIVDTGDSSDSADTGDSSDIADIVSETTQQVWCMVQFWSLGGPVLISWGRSDATDHLHARLDTAKRHKNLCCHQVDTHCPLTRPVTFRFFITVSVAESRQVSMLWCQGPFIRSPVFHFFSLALSLSYKKWQGEVVFT